MVMPRPTPPVTGLRDVSKRMNGLNTSSRLSSGMPGPSSSMTTSTVWAPGSPRSPARTEMLSPWRTQLSTKLVSARFRAFALPRITISPSQCKSIAPPLRRAWAAISPSMLVKLVSAAVSPPSPRAKLRYSSNMCSISATSDFSSVTPSPPPIISNCSFMRVNGVRRS